MLDTLLAVCGMTTAGLEVPKNRVADTRASDCLNTESAGASVSGHKSLHAAASNRADRFSPEPESESGQRVGGFFLRA